MADIFDNVVLCKECNIKMKKINVVKNGFSLRALQCPKCSGKVYHPADAHEYDDFMRLKNKVFKVKLRLVGNSYAVSIPKEIVQFIREQEKVMDDLVRLAFEDFGKLSLTFRDIEKMKK